MIPLRDTVRSRTRPYITIALIILNVLLFIYQQSMGAMEGQMFIARWSVIPVLGFLQPWRYITANFLHGSWSHLFGNMLFLWIFGDNIEDRIGHIRFLFFYLLTGVLAMVMQSFIDTGSIVPILGASGAIAGVMGAYFVCCPRSRVLTYIPPFFLIPIPSFLYLLGWFGLQFINGVSNLGAESGVAWWAHIGGFVFGFLLIRLMRPQPRPQQTYHYPEQTDGY